MAEAEQFLEAVLKVQLTAPAEALGKRHGNGVAVVHMGKGVGIHRVLHMAADHAGEAVQGQHGTLAGAATGDDVIGCAAVQQDGSQNAALHIGQLCSIVGGVHAVVDHLVAHGLHHLLQGSFNDAVLGGLTVLVDKCDLHNNGSPSYFSLRCAGVIQSPPAWG